MIRIGSFCTGYDGLDMAVRQVIGGELAWVSDIDPGARQILAHHHPNVPNIGDLTAADWTQVEPVDIVTGGYPCQPFSLAGELKGTADERHLWPFIARALRVLRPRIAIFENVANHLRLGFDTVLCDLADLGFDVEWVVVRADEVGAPHQRRRLIVLATAADAPGSGRTWEGLRGRLAERGAVAADAADLGHERGRDARGGRPGPTDGRIAAADTPGDGASDGAFGDPELQLLTEPGAGDGVGERRTPEGVGEPGRGAPVLAWGRYAPAIARWEAATGRPAPWATDDRNRLSPAFVEWMMGLPPGHVTAVPGLTRTAQLKALGNGVVPQQAAAAIRLLLDRIAPAVVLS